MVTNMRKVFASWRSSSVFAFVRFENAFITENTITPSVFTAEPRHPPTRTHARPPARVHADTLFVRALHKRHYLHRPEFCTSN